MKISECAGARVHAALTKGKKKGKKYCELVSEL